VAVLPLFGGAGMNIGIYVTKTAMTDIPTDR
jgi:hypothetical protein